MATVTPLRPPRKKASARRSGQFRVGRLVIAVVIAIILLIAFYVFLHYYLNWLWFGEVHLRTVFWQRITIGAITGPAFAIVFFAIFYGNIEIARRIAPKYRPLEGADMIELVREAASRRVRLLGILVSLVGAIIVGAAASGAWLTFARAWHAVSFGTKDPIFHHDLSFYILKLPAWQYLYSFLFGTLIATLVAAIIAHLILGGVEIQQRPAPQAEAGARAGAAGPRPTPVRPSQMVNVHIEGTAVAHISALVGAIFVVAGAGYLLKAWNLLYSSSGVVFGASYTDVNVRLPIIRGLMIFAFLLGLALIYNAFRGRHKFWPPLAIGAWVVALIVFLAIVPAIWQSLIVNPNQLAKESPYIADNITATRSAYDLTKIAETPYSLQGDITASNLQSNDVTVRNIRLWDPEVLLRSYSQLQELRPYYTFTTVSVDRYLVNGVYTQTMLAPRELNISGLPSQAQTWVNQHITYTHGYGVAVSAVNQVASGGAPDFLVQNVPVTSSAPTLKITQPRIYYGLTGTNYVLVKTKDAEFDYPGPGGDVYTSYSGSGGIPVGSFLNRLALTAHFGDIKFFTSSAITSQSRVIIYDNIKARLAAAAPFLTFDSDPYMVIANGKLYWIVDAYTTTDRYPYSQPNGNINYIRNSVKVVIDAYNGSMSFYVFDPSDPIIRTYEKIFPHMFKPASAMPTVLAQHIRYPEDLFNAQAEMFATYHVTTPGIFYNKGNQWEIPADVSSTANQMNPYYMIMRLPGQTREEFVLILPYVPNGRSNMIAWLGAQSDAPNYGKAVSFEFPASLNVYGPAQVEAAINQDPTISSQRTLWGQQGSSVIFGNLLTVPIGNSLLYVQPLYLESSTTQLPQIQRVIAFYRSPSSSTTAGQQTVVMSPTLGGALASIFGGTPPAGTQPAGTATTTPTTSPPTAALSVTTGQLVTQATAEYSAAQAALRAGNFAEYGRQITALGQTLAKLK